MLAFESLAGLRASSLEALHVSWFSINLAHLNSRTCMIVSYYGLGRLVLPWDGGFDKKIIWAIMNEKAHLFSPVFGARAEGNTNKANGPLGSHRTAQNSV